MKQIINSFTFILIVFISGCNTDSSSNSQRALPPARGQIGEIIMVIDSAKRKTELFQELRKTFSAPVPGLPQNEPTFTMRYVSPLNLNNVLRSAKNMIYVATLDDRTKGGRALLRNFTQSSIDRIKADSSLFMFSKQNEFAQGQEVLHLFGPDEPTLMKNIINNQKRLRKHFENIEKKRLMRSLYKAKEVNAIGERLLKNHQYTFRVPHNYEISLDKDRFTWIRQLTDAVDKNIFISYQPYLDEDVFTDENILKLRSAITEENLRDVENKSVYVDIQSIVPIVTRKISFNKKYAVEARGLWKLSDETRGGPFLSYIFVDEELNRLYYVEGYVDSPGRNKRDFIRELEVILSTFKTESELQTEKQS